MKKSLFVLLLFMSPIVSAHSVPGNVERFHDDEYGVTCWKTTGVGGGISCIPDSLLEQDCGPHEEEQHESRPASNPAPHQDDERFQL